MKIHGNSSKAVHADEGADMTKGRWPCERA